MPPGEYKLSTWYPAPVFTPAVQNVTVAEDAPVKREIKLGVVPTR